jgi:hypothetical protein
VVAFAAVHYVKAYLWEQQRYEPHSHDQRRNAVDRVVSMRSESRAYATRRDLAYRVRYVPGFRLTRAGAEAAANRDLDQVAQAVRRALGIADG